MDFAALLTKIIYSSKFCDTIFICLNVYYISFFSNTIAPNGRASISMVLRLNNDTFMSSEGMRFLVYESNTSASTSSFEATLSRHTETQIDLTPELNMCSPEVSKASVSQRNCLFEWERNLR